MDSSPDDKDQKATTSDDPRYRELSVKVEREIADSIQQRLPEGPIESAQLAETLARILTVEVRQLIQFQGPIPPPDMLREYDAVSPGLADKIVSRADREQDLRHESTRSQIRTSEHAVHHAAIQGYDRMP